MPSLNYYGYAGENKILILKEHKISPHRLNAAAYFWAARGLRLYVHERAGVLRLL